MHGPSTVRTRRDLEVPPTDVRVASSTYVIWMKVNDELEITTAETDHAELGPTLSLELNILLNSSVKFDSILQ